MKLKAMTNRGHVPHRTCISCRKKLPVNELVRFKLSGDKLKIVSQGPFVGGRGCYVCPSEACLRNATRKNLFSRALKSPVSVDDAGIDFSKEG